MKTFVIGDIHGANRALMQCLERSGFDKENDILISLGDIADGWSGVPECVDTLLSVKNLIAIRGNHDVWCMNWFETGETSDAWIEQGGRATRLAYIKSGKIADQDHRDFWKNQIEYHIDDQNRLFVHAGWNLFDGFEKSQKYNLNIRNACELHWSRDIADIKNRITINQKKQLDQFKEIFIGHTAHNDNNFNKYNIWNLDTGAGWSGVLTIMNVDTKEFFQSDNVTILYHDENGRR